MQIGRFGACLLGVGAIAIAPGAAAAAGRGHATNAHAAKAAHAKAPLLKSFTYTPLTIKEEAGYLEARYTITVKLDTSAPSIYLEITSTTSKNVETEVGPEASYGAGVHKVSFNATALPGGTYKVTLFARVRPPKGSSYDSAKPLKSTDPATLVVEEATETTAGAGKVTKI